MISKIINYLTKSTEKRETEKVDRRKLFKNLIGSGVVATSILINKEEDKNKNTFGNGTYGG
jgi:hypothetical protein